MQSEIKKSTVEANEEIEIQLSPFGSFYQVDDNGKDVLQICDKIAFEQVEKAFNESGKEVLVDKEHLAETGGDSIAYAWITAIRIDPILGLMGTIRVTDLGAEAITQKHYRYPSPVWALDANDRPIKLVSVGLTNKPNLPNKTLLNREITWNVNEEKNMKKEDEEKVIEEVKQEEPKVEEPVAEPTTDQPKAAVEVDEPKDEVKNVDAIDVPEAEPTADESKSSGIADIAVVLGLANEATVDEVIASIKALIAQIEQIETAKIEAEAEEAMDGYEVENREAFKQLYVKNRETATAVLSTLKKVTNKQVVTAQKVDDKLVLNRAVKPQPQLSKADIMQTYQSLHGKAASDYLRAHIAELG